MANYKAGDVIRITRIARGMTQEELSENICTVETLSRIENGKHAVKKDTYERLMAKMERNYERSYCLCTSKDMDILNERVLIEDAVSTSNFEIARDYLEELKRKIKHSTINNQYIRRQELNIDYKTERISVEKYIEGILGLINMTVPNYEKFLKNVIVYPFTTQELYLLLSLYAGYFKKGEYEECKKIYNLFSACLDAEYMDEMSTSYFRVAMEFNYALLLKESLSDKCVEQLEKVLATAIKNNYGRLVPIVLSEIATSLENDRLYKKNSDPSNEKPLLLKAFYISKARHDDVYAEQLRKYITQLKA